ncbi:retrovirus-related Pol polyprotein from transposon 297 [Trichonephila clavipes]|nr:retrovirus-related Pol polyprotein from transposon 297 [Trichonephila clavipes]
MPGHIKAGCPKLIKNKTTETLNNIEGNENPDFLNSYTTKGSVNGHEIDILRDRSDNRFSMCKIQNPSSFSGENVWVKQPLSPELVCLPLAVVEISGNFGTVQTKAAVEILNAVQTRSQVKAAREERGIDSGDAKKGEDEASELNKHLHDKQMDRLRELLNKYSKCFSNNPGLTNLVEHEIQLAINQSKPYRMSHRQNEILKNEINRMLKLGIIEVGESDYMSPMILVEIAGKEPRPCKIKEIKRDH